MADTEVVEIKLTKSQQEQIKKATGKKFKKIGLAKRALLESVKTLITNPVASTYCTLCC